jgi:hypothetical protein
MKKALHLCLFLSLILFAQYSNAQGLENFNNYGETGNQYQDSTFLGQDGSTWQYFQCRGDSAINAPTPTLGKARTPESEIISGSITGGCGVLSFQYKQVFSTSVSLDLYINGLKYATVITTGEQGVVKNSGDITINASGDFIIDFKQTSTNSGQVAVDNITWTGFAGGPLPEPTNYPTTFTATGGGYKVTLNWTDATGGQVPTSYLIKGSTSSTIADPTDGTMVANDENLADGSGAVNIVQGTQTYVFTGLPVNTPYYFKIYPYTNSGSLIDYKTDGTVPSANATTPNISILSKTTFNDYALDGWVGYNVLGDQIWVIDSIHGYLGSNACAKMSGFLGTNFDNEDWLISPALDFNQSTNEVLTFMNAYNYTGTPIEVKISNDYDGEGNPNTFTWTNLTATLSPGGWAYVSSGDIDVSAISGTDVCIAFKYTSTSSASQTWELDDIQVTGVRLVGIGEKGMNEFNIYPNPSKGMVNVNFANTGNKRIEVCSILGNTVFSTISDRSSLRLDLTGLTSGVYFIRTSDLNGSNSSTQKLILQ